MRIPTKETCKFFNTSEILSTFLADVRKNPAPSVEEEEELFDRYKNGDASAREQLILRNLAFLYTNAKMYAKDESEVLDYVNEGVIGLDTALEKFDPTLGYKFITYAVWYIKRQMGHYLTRVKNPITRSNNMKYGAKVEAIKRRHFADDGHIPSIAEIKEELKEFYNIDVKEDEDLYDIKMTSISDSVDDEDYTVEDDSEYNEKTASYCECEETYEKEYQKEVVKRLLAELSDKQRDIIKMTFGIGYDRQYSFEEIAEKYSCRAESVEKSYDKICAYLKQKQLVKVLI